MVGSIDRSQAWCEAEHDISHPATSCGRSQSIALAAELLEEELLEEELLEGTTRGHPSFRLRGLGQASRCYMHDSCPVRADTNQCWSRLPAKGPVLRRRLRVAKGCVGEGMRLKIRNRGSASRPLMGDATRDDFADRDFAEGGTAGGWRRPLNAAARPNAGQTFLYVGRFRRDGSVGTVPFRRTALFGLAFGIRLSRT